MVAANVCKIQKHSPYGSLVIFKNSQTAKIKLAKIFYGF